MRNTRNPGLACLVRCLGGGAMLLAAAGHAPIAHAQLAAVSQTQHGRATATLAWITGPPSTATNAQTIDTFGLLDVPAIADNFGNLTVGAVGRAQTEMSILSNGYRVASLGYVSGHSNLAANANASFYSNSTLTFNVTQSTSATLSLSFGNLLVGTMGTGEGSSGMHLFGPDGTVVFSYTHTAMNVVQTSQQLALEPGEYLLRVISIVGMDFATSAQDNYFSTFGVVDITVPAPGGLVMAGVALLGPRRRRA